MTAPSAPPAGARVGAAGALLVVGGTLVFLVVVARRDVGQLVALLFVVALAVSAVWVVLTNRRWRWLAFVVAVTLVGSAVTLMVRARLGPIRLVLALGGVAIAGALGAVALQYEVRAALADRWRLVAEARYGVLLMNPKSGGGKVAQHRLVAEAARRGIESVVLEEGDDLRALAQAAAQRGADVLGMAGGDGSQGVVAAVAAEHGIAFVCIPAGTRNHLALDLGVDRDDVVGALDAFGPARETIIDLGAVNGLTFVNNVSLGLYAEIVASPEYRDAEVKIAAGAVEDLLRRGGMAFDLHLDGPEGSIDDPQLVQVSNNPYDLTSLAGFGSRPRIDTGMLGIVAVRIDRPADVTHLVALEAVGHAVQFEGWQSWTARSIEVRSSGSVAVGIDGESRSLAPPLRFESLRGVLRVRVARGHPGVSPAMMRASLSASTVIGLGALVCGRPSGLVG